MSRRWRFAAGVVAVAVAAAGVTVWLATRPPARGLSVSQVRAERRAYAGAPPVIPHPPLGAACTSCHADTARAAPPLGVAPANPHRHTPGLSEHANCRQCHVFRQTERVLVASTFQGVGQELRSGERMYAGAPPVLPHRVLMREDCLSCHAGEAARPEIRCSHPERGNCLQCHLRPHP